MPYDEASFLSGIAVGRNLKSWPFAKGNYAGVLALTVNIDLTVYSGEFVVYATYRTDYLGQPADVYAIWGDGTDQHYHYENPYNVSFTVNFRHQYEANGTYHVMIFGLAKCDLWSLDSLDIVSFDAPLPCDYSGNFRGQEALKTVPENLFRWFKKNGQNGLELDNLFANDIALEYVPETLLDGISLTDPDPVSMFMSCRSLREIGEGFFSNPGFKTATNWSMIFFGCTSLTEIPGGLFSQATAATTFYGCFWDCSGITGPVPKLWERFPNAEGDYCFSGCRNASNYNEIPASWGGPSGNQ